MGDDRMMGCLEILNGDFEGMRYELSSDETLIGRNPTTDITLLDEGISREHTMVLYDEVDAEYLIEDLQSTNGTKVNGKRVRSATLTHGDEIQIGNTRFRFLLENPPA
jgi:pSer/pThr/pTyr-binding forkhead associated (FHA) protein